MQIIECIPNFSEGRDQKIIDQICHEIKKIKGVKLLNRTSDFDHNRTVLTFIGDPASVLEAAFLAVKKAGQLINLTNHQGVHPRFGATDVLPFVPLKGISIKELLPLVKTLGKKIQQELKIPVFYYQQATKNKEFQDLAKLRKYLQILPSPKKAGYLSIGIRPILIAFNVNLKTEDLKIAKSIAKEIRQSSANGLPVTVACVLPYAAVKPYSIDTLSGKIFEVQ